MGESIIKHSDYENMDCTTTNEAIDTARKQLEVDFNLKKVKRSQLRKKLVIEIKKKEKRLKLKNALLSNNDIKFDVDIAVIEENYTDLLDNCFKLEENFKMSNNLLLRQYYRIGYFLIKI